MNPSTYLTDHLALVLGHTVVLPWIYFLLLFFNFLKNIGFHRIIRKMKKLAIILKNKSLMRIYRFNSPYGNFEK